MARKFELILACDAETSGIAFGSIDPTFDQSTGEKFQAVSFGLIVASAKTLKPIDKLYVEIQHDEAYTWSNKAEEVHGLSRQHLAENGLSRFDAATAILKFIEKHFGPADMIRSIVLAGHNVATFDRYFLLELLSEIGVYLKLGNRHLDTFSTGFTLWNTVDSNELFEMMDIVRQEHNAMEDAEIELQALRYMRQWFREGAKALEAQNAVQ
jgi:hypothetical protein